MNERHIDLREIIDATLQEIAASVVLLASSVVCMQKSR